MNEREWLRCGDPWRMMAQLPGARKARLFAVGLCRNYFPDYEETILEPLEWYADGVVEEDERLEAEEEAAALEDETLYALHRRAALLTAAAERVSAREVWRAVELFVETQDYDRDEFAALSCDLLYELLGNPFRPAAVSPTWLRWGDGVVARMAAGVYEDAAFERLPILADALLDAGCDDEELLAHLRSEGPHVRGCWALDLLLAKG